MTLQRELLRGEEYINISKELKPFLKYAPALVNFLYPSKARNQAGRLSPINPKNIPRNALPTTKGSLASFLKEKFRSDVTSKSDQRIETCFEVLREINKRVEAFKHLTYSPFSKQLTNGIEVQVECRYFSALQSSIPAPSDHMFVYQVKITNVSYPGTVQLVRRQWRIVDAEGKVQTVKGPGVVGKHPILRPGESFQYDSFTYLSTDLGTMSGEYEFVALDDEAVAANAEYASGKVPTTPPQVIGPTFGVEIAPFGLLRKGADRTHRSEEGEQDAAAYATAEAPSSQDQQQIASTAPKNKAAPNLRDEER